MNNQIHRLVKAASVMLCVGLTTAQAWHVTGRVLCDENGNAVIDSGDTGVQGVIVAVENSSGSFTATASTAADGSFLIDLPHSSDSYLVYLHPPTLPPGASVLVPSGSVYSFSVSDTNQYFDAANFLLDCTVDTPPPAEGADCDFVTGGGWILNAAGAKVTFGISGGTKGTDFWGSLNLIDHSTGLHVRSTAVTGYGVDPANPNGRVIHYNVLIGTTEGTAVATVVDNGEPGAHDTLALTLSNGYSLSGELGGARPGGGNLQLHTCHGRGK